MLSLQCSFWIFCTIQYVSDTRLVQEILVYLLFYLSSFFIYLFKLPMIAWVFFLFFHLCWIFNCFFPTVFESFLSPVQSVTCIHAICFFFPGLTSDCYSSPNIFSAFHSFLLAVYWPILLPRGFCKTFRIPLFCLRLFY